MRRIPDSLCSCLVTLLFSTLFCAVATESQGATVIAVGTAELTRNSEFVFHGRVVERWVAADARGGAIRTYLRFAVTDVLKGNFSSPTVVLSFLGGTANGKTIRVEGMRIPALEEEGVFFVEQLRRDQVFPLYGWDQGRFHVRRDAQGHARIHTHDLRPVASFVMMSARPGISGGIANGVVLAPDNRQAMTLDEFKSSIRSILEAQR